MTTPSRGLLMLMLHAHLPFVRHPEHEYHLEENWLFEAITETYIPLLQAFERLAADGTAFRLTMSVTPPLANMLGDALLQGRYRRHVRRMIELAEKECLRTAGSPRVRRLAEMYRERLRGCLATFDEAYGGDLRRGFRRFAELGCLELVACSATHGFLPLLRVQPEAVRAQVLLGAEEHARHFGAAPRGVWNAECGYYPGLEEVLAEAGLAYFFVDTHGILHAERRSRYGPFAPIHCPNGLAAFARDQESSRAVWSASEGYPGDPHYREYYRDIGHDLDLDYIGPYIHPDGIRVNTGLKYHRITGPGDRKEWYDPEIAAERAATHAANFLFNREKQVEHLAELMDRPPLIVAPFDAELFGHWWYEGPLFLECLLRKAGEQQQSVTTTTPSEYLARWPEGPEARPSMSSWGLKGYGEMWLNEATEWIYPHLHKAAERMIAAAGHYRETTDERLARALNQAARELLLAQSSDWAFIMRTGTAVEYAQRRTRIHLGRFTHLWEMIQRGDVSEVYLSNLEERDNLLEGLDFRAWCERPKEAWNGAEGGARRDSA